ncbi:hypothetical protein GCM10022244_25240 [Streptomyces gulbargensis]|uniref:Secreted protein n=1 Tax=Streptomyces gulbargensis TaxID=364901 RepID=A0ABP7M4X1_9ACTN
MQPSTSSMFSMPPSPATIFSALLAMCFSLSVPFAERASRRTGGPLRHGNPRLAQLRERMPPFYRKMTITGDLPLRASGAYRNWSTPVCNEMRTRLVPGEGGRR